MSNSFSEISHRLSPRAQAHWLGAGAPLFAEAFSAAKAEASDSPVLVVEAQPLAFLGRMLGAASRGAAVVAGNPLWTPPQWAQARAVLQPSWPSGLYFSTGGTGGRLKFARHTWQTLQAAAQGYQQFFKAGAMDNVAVLPVWHIAGFMQAMRSLVSGGTCRFAHWQQAPSLPGRGHLSVVGRILAGLLESPEGLAWLKSFEVVMLGGAPPAHSWLEAARQAGLPLHLSYGMTEAAATVAVVRGGDFLAGEESWAEVLPHWKVTCPEGEIALDGPALFLGYNGQTPPPLPYLSGDAGHLDKQGHLAVQGRLDDCIISGGEKVFPEDVRQAVLRSGLARDAAVLGLPDETWGQCVALAYQPACPQATEEAVAECLRECLPAWARPRWILAVESLPELPNGKRPVSQLKSLPWAEAFRTP